MSTASSRIITLPALVDPHVHFRTPGAEHKENWMTGAKAAIAGGVTTVLDMPNTDPSCRDLTTLREKKARIDAQLEEAGIPLRYGLYIGADSDFLDQIEPCKDDIVGIKAYLGHSTGDLLVEESDTLDRVFEIAHQLGLVVAVHAEDQKVLTRNAALYADTTDPADHSRIRSPEAARVAVERVLELSAKWGTRLYIVHMSTEVEIDLVRKAKKAGIPVYAEATPHHLFLDIRSYEKLGTLAQMNPPLRSPDDVAALWEAIDDGTIDTIGTDHAPHTLSEKAAPYGQAPSGVPGVETVLPLLLNRVNEGKLSLDKVIELTHTNPSQIFGLAETEDQVICDMQLTRVVDNASLATKCKWSPFAGLTLTGWPIATILRGKRYDSHLRYSQDVGGKHRVGAQLSS